MLLSGANPRGATYKIYLLLGDLPLSFGIEFPSTMCCISWRRHISLSKRALQLTYVGTVFFARAEVDVRYVKTEFAEWRRQDD